MSEKKPGDYEVGYCKPPVATRFKPGQSGNPAGAKRKVTPTNLSEAISQALMKKQTVRINGRCRRIPRMEIIGEQITSQATSGDKSAIRDLLRHERDRLRYAPVPKADPDGPRKVVVSLNIGDEETQRRIEERMIEDGIQAARKKVGEEPSEDD
jgi:hypothetical protein